MARPLVRTLGLRILEPGTREVPVSAAVKMSVVGVNAYYREFRALRDVNMDVRERSITAIIGPSGCGKSTLLRALNRMNDDVPGFRLTGSIGLDGEDIHAPAADPVDIRRRVGMVFQRPNPFVMSIFDNVAWGPKLHLRLGRAETVEIVERSLRQAALWDEVKDGLKRSALSLSGGQQQRLCIARCLAVEPEVVLMDEPCSALDPIATLKIEELMRSLRERYTIVIVTHNMHQAARVSDQTAVMMMGEARAGELIEFGDTAELFANPKDRRTEDYITGRVG